MNTLPPAPVPCTDPACAWNALFLALMAFWVFVIGVGLMTTDISFLRHRWRWVPRFCLHTCAALGLIGLLFLYYGWRDIYTSDNWTAFQGVVDTPLRQAFVYGTLFSAAIGIIYVSITAISLAVRLLRYLAAGPPWMPWDRELDRQIHEEFHKGAPR